MNGEYIIHIIAYLHKKTWIFQNYERNLLNKAYERPFSAKLVGKFYVTLYKVKDSLPLLALTWSEKKRKINSKAKKNMQLFFDGK